MEPVAGVFFLDFRTRSLAFWSLLIVCLLSSICEAQGALTTGEIEALEQLYANFPFLALAHRRLLEFPTGDYFGKAWTTNFASYCDHGEGYGFNGIYCQNGHISGINANQQWDYSISSNFSLISGLQYLTNITIPAPYSTPDLATAIVRALPVKHLFVSTTTLESDAFTFPAAVLSLEAQASSTFNLSVFTNLQVLRLSYFPPPSIINTWVWPHETLEVLEFGAALESNLLPVAWWLDQYPLLPALRELKGTWQAGNGGIPIPAVIESQTLQILDIILRDFETPVNLTINCSTCSAVRVSWSPTSTLNITAPDLQKLELYSTSAWPYLYTPLPYLTELIVNGVGKYDSPASFPNLDFAPLTSFSWSSMVADHANWVRILCSLPSTIRSLYFVAISLDKKIEVPTCSNLNALTAVSISGGGTSYNATLFQNLPTTLTSLSISSIFSDPVPIDNLQKFTQLQTLDIFDQHLVGDIPADFLIGFPQLSIFSIRSFSVTGTIPSTGWNSIEKFTLDSIVTAWEGIDSAPNLKRLLISSGQLARIPSNEQFLAANLQSLVFISISGTQLTGLVPIFWNSLPKLEEVYFNRNLFSGPFNTTISSTSLIMADFSENQICGSLPDVIVPIRPDILRFSNNQFSGSIPDSWSANLSCISELGIFANPINGTVPDGLLDHNFVDISDTDLVGPVWNMSRFTPYRIAIVNSGIDICAVDPGIPSGKQPYCLFDNIPSCPQDCASYWPCLNTPTCNRLNLTAHQVGECIAPPVPEAPPTPAPQPAPAAQPVPSSVQCPLPSPPGFICDNGQYISNGSVTLEVVTLPSEAGAIIVKGNLSINGTLTFSGLGSTIEVEGCVEVVPIEVHIILTSEHSLPPTTLINQKGSNCVNDLSKIPVIVDERKDSCKRPKLSTSDSTRSALVVAFTIDSSRCNVKWIILGSVLGGIILLATVALLLLHLFSPKFRKLCKNNCRCKK